MRGLGNIVLYTTISKQWCVYTKKTLYEELDKDNKAAYPMLWRDLQLQEATKIRA